MTDEELCKALRSALWGQGHHINIKAADRIEALTAENKRLGQQCEGLMQAGMNNGQALIIAEAKLAKAVEGLREIAGECGCSTARAIIAEIEGGKG
jgi:hypothetical protein